MMNVDEYRFGDLWLFTSIYNYFILLEEFVNRNCMSLFEKNQIESIRYEKK